MEEAADGMAETGNEPVQYELRVVGCCARMTLDRAEVDTSIFLISDGHMGRMRTDIFCDSSMEVSLK